MAMKIVGMMCTVKDVRYVCVKAKGEDKFHIDTKFGVLGWFSQP